MNLKGLINKLTRARAEISPSLWKQKFVNLFGMNYDMDRLKAEFPNPFEELPNVSSLGIKVRQFDPLLSKHFVSKRLDPELVFCALSWRTKSSNRYMRIMHGRLVNLLLNGDIHGFWILGLMLMEKSTVLRAVALRKWDLNWHRNYSFAKIKQILSNLDKIINDLPTEMLIIRNYVEKTKPDGTKTYRPIGNPSYEARMFFYMWQCLLVMFSYGYVSKSQHAYFPKRGVITALKELNDRLQTEGLKSMWEFDLKGAFPSIKVNKATALFVKDMGMPKEIADYIEAVAVNTVERVDLSPHGRLLPELKFDKQIALLSGRSLLQIHGPVVKKLVDQHLRNPSATPADSIFVKLGLFRKPFGIDKDFTAKVYAKENVLRVVWSPLTHKGFPQGAGTSPILFNMAFEIGLNRGKFIKEGIDVTSYADDFLTFAKENFGPDEMFATPMVMRDLGLEFNKDKSRQLISDGKWVVDNFKFLGVTLHVTKGAPYNSSEIIWEGTPRSGKTLIFDKEEMILDFERRARSLLLFVEYFEIKCSEEKLLALWSDRDELVSLLPWKVLTGEISLTKDMCHKIKEIFLESLKDEGFDRYPNDLEVCGKRVAALEWAKTQQDFLNLETLSTKQLMIERFNRGFGGTAKSHPKGKSYVKPTPTGKGWLDTRIAGLITNRLHGGSWSPLQSEAVRKIRGETKLRETEVEVEKIIPRSEVVVDAYTGEEHIINLPPFITSETETQQTVVPKAERSWIELMLRSIPKRPFHKLPRALKDWVVSQPAVIEAYKELDAKWSIKPPRVNGDQWATRFLKRLMVQENIETLSEAEALNLNIYNSTSHATLASLKFIKDPSTYKIVRKQGGQLKNL